MEVAHDLRETHRDVQEDVRRERAVPEPIREALGAGVLEDQRRELVGLVEQQRTGHTGAGDPP
ncbi:MAG: hypothetical protein M5U28_56090 [Sandaracinaceae bacterium]|nr:hypothetical protein [Sandaracinaceae bacterium]